MTRGGGSTATRRALAIATCLVLALLLAAPGVIAARSAPGTGSPASVQSKLRNGLDALVADVHLLDPRLKTLIGGWQKREIPAFVLLHGDVTADRTAQIGGLGGRILRTYRSAPLLAIAARPSAIKAIAALTAVRWMSPVRVTVAFGEPPHQPMVDQSDPPIGNPIDLGVPKLWNQGITGKGITIAVIDTGVDMTHPDLDDLDFRHWNDPPNLPGSQAPAKITDARNFNGGLCQAPGVGAFDGNGHGSHVAAIAAGTGEGDPTTNTDDGRVMGIAPDAKIAAAKALTDAGAGVNSDLLAAMEWAAMPAGTGPLGCPSVGAQIVNMSVGDDARPNRLNSGNDVDVISYMLDGLAAKYGTLFVASQGNLGPYIGSALEAPGSASQALSVGATAKDWDVNHDATASGDACSGYDHPEETCPADAPGTQGPSLAPLSSRGPTEGRYLKPDVVAPGENIVSAQATSGVLIAQNDLNSGTRDDPYYATASGTSMAAPMASGVAALLLQAYHDAYGTFPRGASGRTGLKAPTYALVKAALMNNARPGLRESRFMLSTDDGTLEDLAACPEPGDPLTPLLCDFSDAITGSLLGAVVLQGPRNGPSDPYVGPLGEGAGKVRAGPAVKALRDGVVIYTAEYSTAKNKHPISQDYQGSWQGGELVDGATRAWFVVHSAPGAGALTVHLSFSQGHPSDGSLAIPISGPKSWTVSVPSTVSLPAGGADQLVKFRLSAPQGTPPGIYSGVVTATVSNGQVLHIPVLASAPMHDTNLAAGNTPGPMAKYTSAADVYAKGDTIWPNVADAANGTLADWRQFQVELANGLASATFKIWDTAAGDETYDLYVYRGVTLVASTHPFTSPGSGVTDVPTNNSRGPSTAGSPQVLTLSAPGGGKYTLVVSRARIGTADAINGDFGSFKVTLDEVAAP